LRHERLADDDVLGVLLRLGVVVEIEQAEARQRPGVRVGENCAIGLEFVSANAVSSVGNSSIVAPSGKLSL
jgi:hypothetical protein